jgi:hypothetical protein
MLRPPRLITQRHNGHTIIWKHNVFGGEARDFATVRHRSMSGLHSNADSQSIARTQSSLQLDFSLQFTIRRRLQKLLLDERDIPLRQILCGHCEFTGGKQPTRTFLLGATRSGPNP